MKDLRVKERRRRGVSWGISYNGQMIRIWTQRMTTWSIWRWWRQFQAEWRMAQLWQWTCCQLCVPVADLLDESLVLPSSGHRSTQRLYHSFVFPVPPSRIGRFNSCYLSLVETSVRLPHFMPSVGRVYLIVSCTIWKLSTLSTSIQIQYILQKKTKINRTFV